MLNKALLDQAFKYITAGKPHEAIELIKQLGKDDLENAELGATGSYYLFDWAVTEGQLDVANAIIEQYAKVCGDGVVKPRPLAIDYQEGSDNVNLYRTNQVGCIGSKIFGIYQGLVEVEKIKYLASISEETKKLRV